MTRRTLLSTVLLALAAACGPSSTEPSPARPASAVRDDETPPPPPDSTNTPADTTGRGGGGTIGSGT